MSQELAPPPLEKNTETCVGITARPVSATNRNACLVHIYPTGPNMGTRYALGDTPLSIGRAAECEIRIHDNSVSRRHARIQPGADGYYAVDMQSTNGTYVNDMPAFMHKMKDGDYLRVGNCIYRFLTGGNVESDYHEEIYRLTIMDGLTEIHNKRYMMEFLDRELARAVRYDRPLSLIMIDLDRFKTINDDLGHLGGDFTLRDLVSRIKTTIRKEELFARFGGEEFVVVLPETELEGAVIVAERLVNTINSKPFQFEGRAYPVTISAGVCTRRGVASVTPSEMIRQADEKLYQAKNEGRNRVCW